MNSATGIIREGTADQDISDRRRNIKLVARKKGGKAFRINIADDLLDSVHSHRLDPDQAEEAARTDSAQSGRESGAVDRSHLSPSSGNVAFVLATAAAAGLIIGYLAGRKRE